MFRRFAAVLAVAFIGFVGLMAAEYKGKVLKYDTEKNTVTIKTEDGEKVLTYTNDSKFLFGKKEISEEQKTKMLKKEIKEGKEPEVTAITEKKDGKEVVTELKFKGRGGKKGGEGKN